MASLWRRLSNSLALGVGATLLIWGLSPVAGCIYPDHCIVIGISGINVCQPFNNASGVDAQGELVSPIFEGNIEVVHACDCMSQDELDILEEEDTDSLEYQALALGLDTLARQRCVELALEQGLVDNNCLTAPSVDGGVYDDGVGNCTVGCFYANPPPWGECKGECAGGSEDTTESSGGAEETSGGETSGGVPGRKFGGAQ